MAKRCGDSARAPFARLILRIFEARISNFEFRISNFHLAPVRSLCSTFTHALPCIVRVPGGNPGPIFIDHKEAWLWRFMTCLDWKSAALRRLSARFHRERELRFNGKGGVKKALWNIDRYDLTRASFFSPHARLAEMPACCVPGERGHPARPDRLPAGQPWCERGEPGNGGQQSRPPEAGWQDASQNGQDARAPARARFQNSCLSFQTHAAPARTIPKFRILPLATAPPRPCNSGARRRTSLRAAPRRVPLFLRF